MHLARLVDEREVQAFEYFNAHSLPILRGCQPPILWRSTIGWCTQENVTFRRIAIAIGIQQRRLLSPSPDDKDMLVKQAEKSYGQAIYSLRRSIALRSPSQAPLLGFACVLMITLESLRQAPQQIILHLRCGVNIVAEMIKTPMLADEGLEVCTLLLAYCFNSLLYCYSPIYTGDFKHSVNTMNMDFVEQLPESPKPMLELVILGITSIRLQWEFAETSNHHLWRAYSLRARLLRLKARLETTTMQGKYVLVSAMLMQIWVDRVLLCRGDDVVYEEAAVATALSAFQDLLQALNEEISSGRTLGFTLGFGVVQMVEHIIQLTTNKALQQKAALMLHQCPVVEGLWLTKDVKEWCRTKLPTARELES